MKLGADQHMGAFAREALVSSLDQVIPKSRECFLSVPGSQRKCACLFQS